MRRTTLQPVCRRVCALGLALFLPAAAAHAQGRTYACQSSREFYEVNIDTGALTLLGNISGGTISASLAYDCQTQTVFMSSTFAFAGQSKNLYRLNLASRQASLIGPYGDPAILFHSIDIDTRTGILYGFSNHNGGLYTINKSTGAATLIGTSGLTGFSSMAYDADTGAMLLCNGVTLSLYRVNLATGAVTLIGPLNGPINIGGMAYNIDNQSMYLVDNDGDKLYKVNVTTGATGLVGPTGPGNLIGLVYVSPTCDPLCATLLAQPGSTNSCAGAPSTFAVDANGTGTITYQWQAADAGAPGGWVDLAGGPVTIPGVGSGQAAGVGTPSLQFTPTSGGAWQFRCLVSNGCGGGPVISNAGALAVSTCPGDANADFSIGLADIAAIVNCWSQPSSCDLCADLDGSGDIGLGDIAEVVGNWAAPCE